MSITDFSQELQGLCEKLPVQASKIKTLTQLAVKESNVTGNNKQSAQIINEILQFARTLKPEGMLPLVYLIDSIIRSSSKLPNNVYKAGFESIFPRLFKIVKLCLLGDKDKIKRVISIWKANNLLDPNLLDDVLMIFQGLTEQSSAANVPAMNVNAVDPRKNDLNPVQTFLMPDLKPAMPSPVATMNDLPQIDMTMLNKLASSIGNQSTLQSTAQAVNTSHINTVPQQQSVAQMAPALFPQLTNMMAPPFMNIQQPAPVNLDQNQQLQANAAMMSNLLALMAASGQQPGAPNAINMNALLGIAAMGGVPGMGLPIPNMPFNSSMNTLPEQDSHRNQGDRFDRRDDKNRERRDYRDYRDNDSHRKDERSNRRDNHRDSQKKGGPITLNLADGPECAPAYHDPSIPQDCLKIMSRTLFVANLPPRINVSELEQLLKPYGRIESLTLKSEKQQAFIKIATRDEAEAVYENMNGKTEGTYKIRVGWGCGYGPREHFDYAGGYNLFPISKIPDSDKKFIENSKRGGGKVENGYVCEEPDVPLDNVLNVRGNANAPRQGLPRKRAAPY